MPIAIRFGPHLFVTGELAESLIHKIALPHYTGEGDEKRANAVALALLFAQVNAYRPFFTRKRMRSFTREE